jgi:hypothetical protein
VSVPPIGMVSETYFGRAKTLSREEWPVHVAFGLVFGFVYAGAYLDTATVSLGVLFDPAFWAFWLSISAVLALVAVFVNAGFVVTWELSSLPGE